MGWASGSHILDAVADTVLDYIPKKHRKYVAEVLIEIFQEEDCDTIDECENEVIAEVYQEMYPPLEDDECK